MVTSLLVSMSHSSVRTVPWQQLPSERRKGLRWSFAFTTLDEESLKIPFWHFVSSQKSASWFPGHIIQQSRAVTTTGKSEGVRWPGMLSTSLQLEGVSWFPLACMNHLPSMCTTTEHRMRTGGHKLSAGRFSTFDNLMHCSSCSVVSIQCLGRETSHRCLLHWYKGPGITWKQVKKVI